MSSFSMQLILVLQEIICLQKQLKVISCPRAFRLITMELHTASLLHGMCICFAVIFRWMPVLNHGVREKTI